MDPGVRGCLGSFELDGEMYPSVEHYYQAAKYAHLPDQMSKILRAPTALECKKVAGQVAAEFPIDIAHWEEVQDTVMKRALHAKFEQNPALRAALVGTGTRELSEDPGKWPSRWTTQPNGGIGRLGGLLMATRSLL